MRSRLWAFADYQHTVPPRDTGQNGVGVRKRKAVPHGAANDRLRIVFRQDGAKHVECTDVGRGLAASVRVRGEDEVCKRLPQHDGKKYIKSAGRLKAQVKSLGTVGEVPMPAIRII